MTTDTRETVKIHYISLTKPELVKATIRKQKDVTRRVICRQNSTIGEGGDWSKLCWDGSAVHTPPFLCTRCSVPPPVEKAPLPFRDEGFPDPNTGEKNYQYLHVPYDWAEDETIYRVYPRWEPGTMLGIKESWVVSDYSQKFPGRLQIVYRAGVTDDHPEGNDCDLLWRDVDMDTWQRYAFKNQWRGPRFMPGFAVRLFAKVKSVRPERVQEITEVDAVREGLVAFTMRVEGVIEARRRFATLWESINASSGFSWETNPWVWRLEWELITSTGLQVEGKT